MSSRVISRLLVKSPSLSTGLKSLSLENLSRLDKNSFGRQKIGTISISTSCIRSFNTQSSSLTKSTPSVNAAISNDDAAVTKVEFSEDYEGMTVTTTDGIKGRPIYLDAQATTPLDPRVLDAMLPYLTSFFGNPHSRTHAYGWESEKAVEASRELEATAIRGNGQLFRLPYKVPSPIINPQLRIDYQTPTRHPMKDIQEDPSKSNTSIQEAPKQQQVEKHAARLIVIRRSKMNRHKLKKLRKKMKYVWAKVKLRRQTRKEKAFLNMLMSKIKEAEKFDAKSYVTEVIRKAKEKPPVVMYWRRNKLPDWLVKEKLAQKAAEEQKEYLSILDKRDQKS